MTDTVFFTDSTADLSYDFVTSHGIRVIGLNYTIDGVESLCTNTPFDPDCLEPCEFYARMRAGATPTTALINNQRFHEQFEPVMREGRDVFYVTFSSGLSNSGQNAIVVGRELIEKYPERRVTVIDSLNASMGEGMVMALAIRKHEEGLSDAEVEAYCNGIRLRIHSRFTVDDLTYLKRSGRVSGAAAMVGGMLNLKPVMYVNREGKLVPGEKVQGRKRALKALVDHMEADAEKGYDGPLFIAHGDCESDARLVEGMVHERFGQKADQFCYITPIIGAHSGPGTVALFYLGANERAD